MLLLGHLSQPPVSAMSGRLLMLSWNNYTQARQRHICMFGMKKALQQQPGGEPYKIGNNKSYRCTQAERHPDTAFLPNDILRAVCACNLLQVAPPAALSTLQSIDEGFLRFVHLMPALEHSGCHQLLHERCKPGCIARRAFTLALLPKLTLCAESRVMIGR